MKNSKNYENYRRQLLDATENKDWSEQLDAALCLVELYNKKACIAQHYSITKTQANACD